MNTDEPQNRKIDGEQVVFYRGEGWRCGNGRVTAATGACGGTQGS
jgi:hypothetical protein